MTEAHQGMDPGGGSKDACPHCNRLVPCGVVPKEKRDDILDRIKDFQTRLWERKQKDSLESISEAIIREVINLRIKLSGLLDRESERPGYIPPAVCPHCNKRLPYGAVSQKSQRDILDRIKDLQTRLKERKPADPAYAILEDAQMEIEGLRGKIEELRVRQ